ncbi:pre-mRNA-processing factor 17 [Gryganskiella cystojenkinii]|nr:pre-mRNA-processing factor 17 [Gryganskiella cystojenkinii]
MDLIHQGYGSSSEDEDSRPSKIAKTSTSITVNVAPDVSLEDPSMQRHIYTNPTDTTLAVNLSYDSMLQPVHGPSNPFATSGPQVRKNVWTGHVEQNMFSDHDFRTQQQSYTAFGFAKDPSVLTVADNGQIGAGVEGSGYVGDITKAHLMDGATIWDKVPKNLRNNQNQRKRQTRGDASVLEGENAYRGPWATYDGEGIGEVSGPSAEEREKHEKALEKSEEEKSKKDTGANKTIKPIAAGTETSKFHGKEEHDYMGRTYMHVPLDLDVNLRGEAGSQECFVPKRLLHTYTGHTKGVSAIRLFPKSGHLLLSGSMDSKVKLWDVYHERRVLRTFMGHSKAVRDVTFNNDGSKFMSASYDRNMKLWDTETGQCISTFTTKKIPYVVKFNPDEDKQNVFLAGCSDHKIYQFDINSGEVIQEYDQHLGPVNSITFVDDNRRFVTTSDDKSLRAWEYDIPVVIKYIAEPDMHSMPAVALSPNQKWLACQSLDNQIFVYGAKDRFRQNRKKLFSGHMVAGYACQPSFSPDGRYLSSGDSEGNLWVWDWKTCKVHKKFKAHNEVLIDCVWHPHETSLVATASWDSTIKLWN